MRTGFLGRLLRGARRPRVTVCIPAYRSGSRIAETLASVQAQRFADFRVVVGVEPTGADALDAATRRAFERDRRFRFVDNASIQGWGGNVAALMAGVETEFFAVLPHDDLWHEDYLAVLVDVLDAAPEAAVAFSDMRRFGQNPVALSAEFDNEDPSTRLFSYYAQGAPGHGWRGLVRRDRLGAGYRFPQNRYLSFAVECEFFQVLLLGGAAIRVPREMYRKRGYAPATGVNVSSRWRRDLSPEAQRAALAHHRQHMLAGIPEPLSGRVDRAEVLLAAEIALWRRGVIFAPGNPEVAAGMHAERGALEARVAKAPRAHRAPLRAVLDEAMAHVPPVDSDPPRG